MTTTAVSIIKRLLLFFLVFTGLYYAKIFLMPLATGAVLAALFLPFCKWMEDKKLPKGLAALSCLLVLLLAFAGVAALVSWQIAELTSDIELLKEKGGEAINRMKEYINQHFGISHKKQEEMLEGQQTSANGMLTMIAGSLSYIFYCFVLMLVYLFLLLYYRIHIRDFLLKLFPPPKRKEMEQVIYNASHVSQQYLLGLAKMIVCLWIMYSIGFSLAGVKNPFFFAILCGLLEIVPFIGNITGTGITVLVSTMDGASFSMIGGILLTYGTVQFLQGWVLEPIIVGPQVKINPMATVLALVLGELLWGIPGIILAIPLMAMFKILCDHIEPLKPYAFLIGEIKTEKKETAFQKKLKSWFKRRR